ncbi:hypothetical protein DL764_008066 [Monosporascus ibericus]|uniref:Peptidase S8/S53 domain-containing protein n=1 Tax=Monosporascus ibericus TaxID=155417 RepID=A0A4Q4T0N6_9PEZI|nr:hypothetical protein DL764_008066 [Monosporascus ibericus]
MRFLPTLLATSAALAAAILEAVSEKIPGEWIVALKPDASADAVRSSILSARGTKHKATYSLGSFRGFKLSAADEQIAAIAKLAEIAYIEPDQSREPGTADYVYDDSAGEGTYAYVIDSGIYTAHPDFEGRASFGATFADEADESDHNGHDTHVAGTIGPATYGVAKKTELIAVKVIGEDGKGLLSNVIEGLEGRKRPNTYPSPLNRRLSRLGIGKSVANLSVGGPRLGNSMNEAAAAAVSAGLFLSVASGNSGWPAILYTPASEPTVCTVGATDDTDAETEWSNYGGLVDVLTPGANITSTWIDGGVEVLSGTSMAAPHVAGLAAYLLALEGERDPIALCERIQEFGTKDVVRNARSDAILAFNGATEHLEDLHRGD